jgi:hypothetical protein
VHNTDGRSWHTVADQLEAHCIGTLGRRLGSFASFVVAAGLEHDNCAGACVSGGSGYDVSRQGG